MKGKTDMSEKKDTKTFIMGNENIFDDSHLDERQKIEAYKTTFKLFIAMFYTMLFMSMIVFIFAAGTSNISLLVTGAAGMLVTELFIVLYAAMTSSKGAMNLKFAKRASTPAYAVSCIILAAAMFFVSTDRIGQRLNIKNISMLLYVLIYASESLLLFYYSRRNMKVLEKQLKDDEENDE